MEPTRRTKHVLGVLSVLALCMSWFIPVAPAQATTRANFTLKVVEEYSRIIVQAADGAYYLVTTSNGCYFTDPPDGGKTLSLDVNSKGAPQLSGILYDTQASENCAMVGVSELTFVSYGVLAANSAGSTATLVSYDAIPVRYALTFGYPCSQLSSVVGQDVHVRQAGLLNGTSDTLYLFTKDQNCSVSTVTRLTPTVSLTTSASSVGEAAGSATVTAQLSFATDSVATVQYATSNGTATALDYTPTSGTLTFSAGTTTATFTVPVTNDTIDEANESLTVTLSSPTNATLATLTSQVVTIVDNDNAPTIINEKLSSRKLIIEHGSAKHQVLPFGAGYKGSVWAKRVEFEQGESPRTVVVPTSAFGKGTIKVYNENGKVIQNLKPFGVYINQGVIADIIQQPSSGKVYVLVGFKQSGFTVRVYELTASGLHAVANLPVVSVKNKGTIYAGFRKLYNGDYGLAAMKQGSTSTLQVWKISAASKFTKDSAKGTLAKLRVVNGKIVLK